MKNYFLILMAIIITLASCKKDKIDLYEEVYEVEFISTWSNTTHPTEFPSGAHFSPMAAISHIEGLDIISEGLIATTGIQNMAETGSTTELEEEFDLYRTQTYALDKVIGNSFDSPGSNKIEIGVERGRHTVSIFSMIAPSPDWFVAINTSLVDPNDGEWYDEVIVHASTYDAGTDSGISFTSENLATNPKEAILQITSGPLTEGATSVQNIGTFVFKRIK